MKNKRVVICGYFGIVTRPKNKIRIDIYFMNDDNDVAEEQILEAFSE